jgi:hypothetical protein
MNNDVLKTKLDSLKMQFAELPGTNGGTILVVDAGARILRLIGKSGTDFLWLNKSYFENPSSFDTKGWLNQGGDRTWVAPERNLNFLDLNDPWNTYDVPKGFDPGNYELQHCGDSVMLSNRFKLWDRVLGVEPELSIEKKVVAVSHPFRHSTDSDLRGVEFIGYQQTTTLSLFSDPVPGMQYDLWFLAQLEHPGEILIPVTSSEAPKVYAGQPSSTSVRQEPGLIRFELKGQHQKIGVKSDATLGRGAFVKDEGNGFFSLVVRNFNLNPSGEYIDVPLDNTDDRGYAVHCYCDDGKLGNFGELEYHTPGIGDGTGSYTHTDINQLWAFRAEKPLIERILKRLLNVAV